MRKSSKFILVILVILITVMAMSAFVACKKKPAEESERPGINNPQFSVTFISNDETVATKIDIDKAKEILASQPTREGYVFKGWYLDKGVWKNEVTTANIEEVVRADVNVYAYWVEVIDRIEVRFLDYTGAELLKNVYERSDDQLAKDLASLRPSNYEDDKYSYTFDKWDCDISDNTQELFIATPTYTRELRIFEVNFYVDGNLYYTDYVKYGDDADLSKVDDPTKPLDDVFKYEFVEWVGNLENITQNTNVSAKFNEIFVIVHTVVFVNWEGTRLDTVKVEEGQPVVYGGEIPTRDSNEMYTYEFAGWATSNEDAKLENVTCNFVATAQFNEKIRTYTITFTDDDDNVISTLTDVPYGTDLRDSSTFSIPTNDDAFMESTPKYDYTFIDWDQYLNRVYSDMTVKGIYKKTIRRYIVQFINNGHVISTQEVEYDQYPSLPASNIFTGVKNDTVKWNFEFFSWQVLDVDTTVDGVDGDLDVDDGTDYRYTVTSTEGLEKLDPASNIVHGAITYTAVYSRTIQQYIVKFFNEENDAETLKEITVPWGTNVLTSEIEEYQAPTPFKESVPKWDYEFTNWSRDLTKVESNISVFAEYLAHIRSYLVTFFNDGEQYGEPYMAEYDSVLVRPEVDPTKVSTLEFDFFFDYWDKADNYVIQGETNINAVYRDVIRSYVVTLFNLATKELISTGDFAYGTKITTKINVNGYDFDHWYRDPNCDTIFNQEEEFVDGPMMLFGNIVMKGLEFKEIQVDKSSNPFKHEYVTELAVVGYNGVEDAQISLILPMAFNGLKVTHVAERGLASTAVTKNSIGSIYIPSTIDKVEAYAFSGLNLTDTGGIYVQTNKAWGSLTKPKDWAEYWNRDNLMPPWNEKDRPVTYGVAGVYSVGDYQYMLFDNGEAYVDRFINNTAANAFISDKFTHQLASFDVEEWVDTGKTETRRNIYTMVYTDKDYSVTQIAVSAFENCENLSSIYLPTNISKVGKYAFSGVTANVYIQQERPKTLGVEHDNPDGWSSDWNKNRDSKSEADRTLHWGVIGYGKDGDFNYIFKTKGTAIAAEYLGNKSTVTKIEVPNVATFKGEEYRVEELVDELLSGVNLLTTVTLGENVKKLGKKIFANDVMLSTVNVPDGLEEIGEQAFLMNMALKQIYIPSSVKKVGSLAFIGIDNLTIYTGKSKPLIGESPSGFALGWDAKIGVSDIGDIDLTNIMKSITTILGKFTQSHDKVWDVAGLPYVEKVGTALPGEYTYLMYTDGHAELISSNIPVASLNTSYTIPSSITYKEREFAVTTIKASAFAGNTRIKELFIPTSVTTIEANAFQGCSSLTIDTDHTSKPSGWDSNFNPDSRTVNYKIAEVSVGETTEGTDTTETTENTDATVSETAEAKKDETEEAA